jgi:hypothetical protein
MKKNIVLAFWALLIFPVSAISAAFTDLVRVDGFSEIESGFITFFISPPVLLSESEASWPLCWTLRVRAPLEPTHSAVTPEEHRSALTRLREAVRTKDKVYFGPAGNGLIPSKENRCQLNSKGLISTLRSHNKDSIISFHD